MACHPDPDKIAGDIESLEIPGALASPAREYIARLVQRAPYLERLKVGRQDSNDPNILYIPDPAPTHQVRTLIVGEHSRVLITDKDRIIELSELMRFPCLTQLHWYPIDPRIGSVQHVITTIYHLCPYLKFLQVPWSNRLDKTPWDALPMFPHLKHITFRFDHDSKISMREFIQCLREFYIRDIPVKVGSGCAVETRKWLNDMYEEIFVHEYKNGFSPEKLLRWVIQHNRGHLLKLTEIPSDMKEAMYEAIRNLDCSDGEGLRLEVDLTPDEIPKILKQNLRYLRQQVNRQKINPAYIPEILECNPNLRSVIVAVHVVHHGASYDGDCTYNKVPLIPGQDEARKSGGAQRFTIPAFELKYRLVRDLDTGEIMQTWRSYPRGRRGGPAPTAEQLPKLNVFGRMNWVEQEWSPGLLDRLSRWENEIKGWFDCCPHLKDIGIILNTDSQKFGRVEKYWCTCTENEFAYL